MCLSKYSNLEHLREVAMNLYSSDDHANMNGLSEKEIAALIHTFYQEQDGNSKVMTRAAKRRSQHIGSANKKLRAVHKVSDILSALELLPNEVYEMILRFLGGEAKKNLRITSKRLYDKTTSVAPMFQNWCFDAMKGILPDFVVETGKNLHISSLDVNRGTDPTSILTYRFADRITSIQINVSGVLLNILNYRPFPNLTSLDVEYVGFDNKILLMLAPQLENLRLANIDYVWWDISSVNEDCKSFTKLKTLILIRIDIDVKKILSKSCNTLEKFEVTYLRPSYCLEDLEKELSSLKHLKIVFESGAEVPLRNLLSKCLRSLRTLILKCFSNVFMDFSKLLEQPMKITSLEIETYILNKTTPRKQSNIEGLLNKCPLVQKLTLYGYEKEVGEFTLKDLRKLKLDTCGSKCMTSVFDQSSKHALKAVEISQDPKVYMECEYPEILELDKILVHHPSQYWDDEQKQSALDKIVKLFPCDLEVTTEKLEFETVFRRLYGLH